MQPANKLSLPASTDTGSTGICHLKRLWAKVMTGTNISEQYRHERELDIALLNFLGLGLLPAYQYLHEQQPDFETFEQWVTSQGGRQVTAQTIQQCNALLHNTASSQPPVAADVLTPEDIAFWEEHGYVVIKNAVAEEDCAASREAIWHYLQMDAQDPVSWYKKDHPAQGIMVPLYRHPAIDKNRNSATIRRAFEQLWQRTDLIVTTDKCGFNPPETDSYRYMGIGLHWDVSLATPIPFGTQGILYLTDTAANQGALALVPGFHHHLENWLHTLPPNTNPRKIDFSGFLPIPVAAGAGDFIIWNHKLPHSSSPNRAGLPRLVQYINWYPPLEEMQEKWV